MQITTDVPRYGVNYFCGSDGFKITYNDAVAAGIRWFELGWDKFQAGLVVPTHAFKILGADLTIEAFIKGVAYSSLSAYINDPGCAVFVRTPVLWTPDMGAAFVKDAPTEVGKPYNFNLIASMAGSNSRLGSILNTIIGKRRFTNWIDGIADSKNKAICSQSTARLDNLRPELHDRGCLAWTPDQETVKPNDLFQDLYVYGAGAVELVPANAFA